MNQPRAASPLLAVLVALVALVASTALAGQAVQVNQGAQVAPVAASEPLQPPGGEWIQLTTANFEFFSNASPRRTLRIAADIEELRAVLVHLNRPEQGPEGPTAAPTDSSPKVPRSTLASDFKAGTLELNSPLPTLIYIFATEASFAPYRLLFQGKPVKLGGYFSQREDGNYIAINGSANQDASEIIYHEYVHYVVTNNLSAVPLWFNEGLAEYFETFQVVKGRVHIGGPINDFVRLLRSCQLIPLAELLAVDRDSPIYNVGNRRERFYAQSWALVHYLRLGNRDRQPQLARYLELVADSQPQSHAFEQAFKTTYEQLEAELRRYLKRPMPPVDSVPVTVTPADLGQVLGMSDADVLYRLGDLLAQQVPLRPGVDEHFKAALALEPGHAQALSGRGYVAMRQRRFIQARKLHAAAAQAGRDDFKIQYRWAAVLLKVSRQRQDREQAIAALLRCTELNPGFGEAWAKLAFAASASEGLAEGAIEAAETARRLLPSRLDVAHNLLRLYLRAGRRDAAQELVDGAFSGDPSALANARSALAKHDIRQALDRLDGNQPEAAERMLDSVAASFTAAEATAEPGRLLAEARLTILNHGYFASYKRALAMFNNHSDDSAQAVLEELLAAAPEGPHVASAQGLLSRVNARRADAAAAAARARAAQAKSARDLTQLNQLIGAGQLEAALAKLRQMKDQGSRQPWIDGKIAELGHAIAHNRFVLAYGAAVDHFNAGRFTAAGKVLDELLAELPEGPDAAMARELLADARAAAR